jgi:hypothetical protein
MYPNITELTVVGPCAAPRCQYFDSWRANANQFSNLLNSWTETCLVEQRDQLKLNLSYCNLFLNYRRKLFPIDISNICVTDDSIDYLHGLKNYNFKSFSSFVSLQLKFSKWSLSQLATLLNWYCPENLEHLSVEIQNLWADPHFKPIVGVGKFKSLRLAVKHLSCCWFQLGFGSCIQAFCAGIIESIPQLYASEIIADRFHPDAVFRLPTCWNLDSLAIQNLAAKKVTLEWI